MPGREYATATAEAAFAAALCIGLLPKALLFIPPLLALALLAASWRRRVPVPRNGDAVFAPDPLRPDFAPLAATLADAIGDAAVRGVRRRIILAPYGGADGRPAEYALFWRPADKAVEITWPGGRLARKVEADIQVLAPMPLRVGAYPVALEISRGAASGRVTLGQEGPTLFTRAPDAVSLRRTAFTLYLAAVICAYGIRRAAGVPDIVLFALIGAAPVLVKRLLDFAPRTRRLIAGNAAFALRLARRFADRE